jgi:hypothetical protein
LFYGKWVFIKDARFVSAMALTMIYIVRSGWL